MPFDFLPPDSRELSGLTNYYNGLAAEDIAVRHYDALGIEICAERWRGRGGEIDLIGRDDEGLIFVEVKRAATMEQAASRLSQRQFARIMQTAEEYAGRHFPGQLVNMRFDLAMVDADGRIEILSGISPS